MAEATCQEDTFDRAALDDSSAVLHARRELEALSVDVITAPGLATVEAGRLQLFLQSSTWLDAAPAARRLAGAGRVFRSEP